ncbi:hypothetical protein GCM10011608_20330 [Micromonospora sonchi]|uniref:RNA polymerase sigma-70 region 2 domain-containing protein n=1 Tax=Micromonospora sonchi TaxID=1763543 RepID=A0A917WVA3_9ACTN|nr:hypothetical protein GCM10011608_20330 [Micromonospora sonchi]
MRQKTSIEDLLRDLAPQVLGVLARRFGDFATAEDAVQEALPGPRTAPGPGRPVPGAGRHRRADLHGVGVPTRRWPGPYGPGHRPMVRRCGGQLAVQVTAGAELVPFQLPRKPKLALAPAPSRPL